MRNEVAAYPPLTGRKEGANSPPLGFVQNSKSVPQHLQDVLDGPFPGSVELDKNGAVIGHPANIKPTQD